jgi:alkylation response protein AidB-like acyl-CoA dehydrogenase
MDFSLSPEHLDLRRGAEAFARDAIPTLREHDRVHTFPRALVDRMADEGFLGICLPKRYGGAGMDYLALGLVAEALEFADSSLRETLAVHLGLHALPIFQWGTERQKHDWLPGLTRGKSLACFALNEAEAGSDAAALRSIARREGDAYVLDGEKTWITLANEADHFLVFAKTDTQRGVNGGMSSHGDITAFVLERGMRGLTTGPITGKLGDWAGDTGWVRMDGVKVPVTSRLGEEGEGFKIAMSALDLGRYVVAAGAVGLMRACLEASVAYAKARLAFGKPIAEQQLVQGMIALMQQRIDAGELLVQKVGWLLNRGQRITREASSAKWFCTEAALACANDAVQIHGAAGYGDAHDVARFLRNARATTIYQGTSQIHALLQAGYALGARSDKPLRCELPGYDARTWQ